MEWQPTATVKEIEKLSTMGIERSSEQADHLLYLCRWIKEGGGVKSTPNRFSC